MSGHARRAEDEVVSHVLRAGAAPDVGVELGPVQVMRATVEASREASALMTRVAIGDRAAREGHQSWMRAAWEEQWLRIWKRYQLPWQMTAFFDDLGAAETREEVCRAVAEHAARIVGGYAAAVLLPDDDGAVLRLGAGWSAGGDVPALSPVRSPGLAQAGLIAALDLRSAVSPLHDLAPLVRDPAVSLVAHFPFGEGGVLLLTERRSERVFAADDWEALGTLSRHGGHALRRLATLENARSAALTDPLTGLANRREMEIVLKHAWPAAERGEGLAVLLLDLDEFKAVNDQYGHGVGDDVLRITAAALREEARGSDAVIRYGGDEFLVVLPRGTASGARMLARRVIGRLTGWIGVSAGAAEYHPNYRSAAELIAAADEDMYARKRAPQRLPASA